LIALRENKAKLKLPASHSNAGCQFGPVSRFTAATIGCNVSHPALWGLGLHMGTLLGFIFGVIYIGAVLIPVARILDRTGINRWAALIAVCPVVNILGLWAFAFSEWPSEIANPREKEKWSPEDNEAFKKALANKKWS
jgi:hypothetical protein